ncbi:MAG: hypothetical protein R2909_10030, partial [Gemmatimonadales bacterium]
MRLDVSRVSSSIGAVALLLAVGTACSSGPTDDGGNGQPGPASAVAKQGGDQQVATVGTSVAAAPTVKVTDAQNRAVSGVSVTFAVASGGGSVTGATATTDASGVAAVGSWTLGTAAGANTLTASATGVSASVTFSATGQAGPPTDLVKAAGDNQIAPPGTAVNVAPQVTLTDEHGNPVSGHAVTFAVATGGGSVTGGNATTDANGQATVGSWTLGAAGAQTLTATAAGNGVAGNPATFTATAQLDPLEPSQDTTLSGTVTAATLTVAAGVTVTVNGSLTLNVSGAASIAGSIQGDCVDVALNVDGALALTGTLANDCAALPDDDPPTLAIVALGGMTVSGAGTINTSGDFSVTDDPTITDADFAPGGFAAPSSRAIVG